jgi:hypothetical protein
MRKLFSVNKEGNMRKKAAIHPLGIFGYQHENPPPPFNPLYKPYAEKVGHAVAQSMSDEGFYSAHNREECAVEYRRRYDIEMEKRGG